MEAKSTLSERVARSNDEVPEETKWETIRYCCGLPVSRVLPSDRLYCAHWEISPCMPIFVVFLSLFPYVLYWAALVPRIESVDVIIVSSIQISMSYILFLWSYFAALAMDPGFLPFDWHRTKRFYYTWQEQLSGLAIRHDQVEYAQSHKPPFASFSHSSGRFVIRGDHICGWVTNWIGKRNHKQFILMTFWGFVFCASVFSWKFAANLADLGKTSVTYTLIFFSAILEISFGISLLYVCIANFVDICNGETTVSKYKNMNGDDQSSALSEVFGDGPCCEWIIPTEAFDEHLVIDCIPPL